MYTQCPSRSLTHTDTHTHRAAYLCVVAQKHLREELREYGLRSGSATLSTTIKQQLTLGEDCWTKEGNYLSPLETSFLIKT